MNKGEQIKITRQELITIIIGGIKWKEGRYSILIREKKNFAEEISLLNFFSSLNSQNS